jgi:N-acetyl-anhydromuramyl-L-alanine amidase AmpD
MVTWLSAACAAAFIIASAPQPDTYAPLPAAPSAGPVVYEALPIVEMPSPHQDDRPATAVIDTLVIHDTETPGVTDARTIVNWFQHPRSQVSAHYIIGKAGELVQCVPDERRAWHAGPSKFNGREKVNDFSIGIELVNAQTGTDPFTEAQYRTLALLTVDLMRRHCIPLAHLTGHRHVTKYPGVKRDPADNFDWRRYKRDVMALLNSQSVVVRQVRGASQARR